LSVYGIGKGQPGGCLLPAEFWQIKPDGRDGSGVASVCWQNQATQLMLRQASNQFGFKPRAGCYGVMGYLVI